MDFYGVYHSDYSHTGGGVCDAPCITKGRMMLCAEGAASQGWVLAMARGRIRNLGALTGALDCRRDAAPSWVVLEAYRRWGADYPAHIEGTVATCVMDAGEDLLVLSRDRMGEQPLFYAAKGGGLAFADHPDLLLKGNRSEPVVDMDGLRELFGLGPARTPGKTPYRDMMELEPGCALICRGDVMRIDRYYALSDELPEIDEATAAEQTRALLEQCVADVRGLNPAVMLSGGLDSTALTALLGEGGVPPRSFSVDYQDNSRDFRPNRFRPELDAPYVMEAVRAFGTQHRVVTLDQQSLARGLDRAVSLRGFPGMADIDVSLLLFAREIARYDSCVVSGECGDEVFGGYPWFRSPAPLEGFPWSGSLELRQSLIRDGIREKLELGEYVRSVFEAHRNRADPGPDFPPEERRLRAMQRLCFAFFMPNLQERALRMCRGAGVEVLTPLCDDRLVAYVYNVPWRIKHMGGQEKGLFRAAVADLLPERLLKRTKSPYPKTCSPQYTAIIRGMALRMIDDARAPLFEIVDRERLRALAESDLDPAETPWYGQLMAGAQLLGYMLQVNQWMRERNVRVKI